MTGRGIGLEIAMNRPFLVVLAEAEAQPSTTRSFWVLAIAYVSLKLREAAPWTPVFRRAVERIATAEFIHPLLPRFEKFVASMAIALGLAFLSGMRGLGSPQPGGSASGGSNLGSPACRFLAEPGGRQATRGRPAPGARPATSAGSLCWSATGSSAAAGTRCAS